MGKGVPTVGVNKIGIVKLTGLLGGQQKGHRLLFAHGFAQRAGDALLLTHPIGKIGGMQLGELADALVERLLGILAHGKKGG